MALFYGKTKSIGYLEAAMNKRLIKIEYKTLPSIVLGNHIYLGHV